MQSEVSLPRPRPATREQILLAIQAMCLQKLRIRIESATDLIEAGILDSMALMEILLLLETQFGIILPMEELTLDALRSLEKIAQLAADCMAAGADG